LEIQDQRIYVEDGLSVVPLVRYLQWLGPLLMPFRAIDLGVGIWTANHLAKRKVVSLGHFSGHFILSPIIIQKKALWITVAFNHVGKNILQSESFLLT
jgi:hypothetical protein